MPQNNRSPDNYDVLFLLGDEEKTVGIFSTCQFPLAPTMMDDLYAVGGIRIREDDGQNVFRSITDFDSPLASDNRFTIQKVFFPLIKLYPSCSI